MNTEEIKNKIIDKLCSQYVKHIAITTHLSPDADAIGSCIALANYLESMNKIVDIIIPSYSSNFNKLVKNANILKKSNRSYDLTILLDCSSYERTIYQIEDLSKYLIVIDHHINNYPIGNLYLCENKASTTRILYDLMKRMKHKINQFIAFALYIGIIGDTAYFSNNNVTPEVYNISAELLNYPIDLNLVNEIFRIRPLEIWKLITDLLSNAVLNKEYHIVYVVILKEDLERYHLTYDIVNYIMHELKNIKEANIAFLFIESKNDTKVKVRSRNCGDLNKIMKYFNGGGHKYAAGASIDSVNIFSVVDAVISQTILYIDEHPEEFNFVHSNEEIDE